MKRDHDIEDHQPYNVALFDANEHAVLLRCAVLRELPFQEGWCGIIPQLSDQCAEARAIRPLRLTNIHGVPFAVSYGAASCTRPLEKDVPSQILDRTTRDLYPLSLLLAEQLTTALRQLQRMQRLLAQTRAPIWHERAMGRSRGGVLWDAGPRGEKP